MSPAAMVALAGALALAVPVAVRAESRDAEPLVLSVTPSGVESPQSDLEALLERRMRRNEFLFRSICRGCGNSDRFSGAGPFDPMSALAAKPKTPSE